ncbi:hypothetical protein SDC9_183194 [bioreactor metagenome]|uniref:Uncharacterized protein n=1 Tax=bioreactor metagenome TaxID=1076179 RepID=A0A645HB12_9ZZZZ
MKWARNRSGKEHGNDDDQCGKTTVAGHKIVGNSGNQPLSGRVNNSAGDNAGGITTEAHTHG